METRSRSGNILNHKDRTLLAFHPLKSGGRLFLDSLDKAEILNTQFKSVFTKEDSSFIPKLFGPNYPTIDPLIINQNEVEKLLSGLNPSKAAGPDQIPCRILKELSVELAPIFSCSERLYKHSMSVCSSVDVHLSVCLSVHPSHFVSAFPGVILLGSWWNLVGMYLRLRCRPSSFVGDVAC